MAIPTDVRTAVVGAYYPHALAVPDRARSRAQAAYGIASAIAAALVAAGVFGNLDQRSILVQVLGVAALVGWLLASGLYLIAVSRPFVPATANQASADAFVNAALAAAKAERDKIDHWQNAAGIVSGLAVVVTVATLIAALVETPASDSKAATVALTDKGVAAVTAACRKRPTKISGSVSPSELDKEFVNMTLDAGICGRAKTVVALPRAQIRAVVFNR